MYVVMVYDDHYITYSIILHLDIQPRYNSALDEIY